MNVEPVKVDVNLNVHGYVHIRLMSPARRATSVPPLRQYTTFRISTGVEVFGLRIR